MSDERYRQIILAVLTESPKALTAQDVAMQCADRSRWCKLNLTSRNVGGILATMEKEGLVKHIRDTRLGRNVWEALV